MDKKIRLAAVKERTPRLIEALTAVWEHSVRTTHHFLSEPEILRIRAYVSQAVGGVAQLVAAENQAGEPGGLHGRGERAAGNAVPCTGSLRLRSWRAAAPLRH